MAFMRIGSTRKRNTKPVICLTGKPHGDALQPVRYTNKRSIYYSHLVLSGIEPHQPIPLVSNNAFVTIQLDEAM